MSEQSGDWLRIRNTILPVSIHPRSNSVLVPTLFKLMGLVGDRRASEHATMWDEGNRRLDEKIQTIKRNPGITFSDFGSRRRWSRTWQERVVSRLAEEIPGQFRGTSNSYLSMKLTISPMGTNAHELPMVYSAIYRDEDEREQRLVSSQRLLEDWEAEYGLDLSVFLPDTGKRIHLFPRRFETHA